MPKPATKQRPTKITIVRDSRRIRVHVTYTRNRTGRVAVGPVIQIGTMQLYKDDITTIREYLRKRYSRSVPTAFSYIRRCAHKGCFEIGGTHLQWHQAKQIFL